jgi:hypothetical protein
MSTRTDKRVRTGIAEAVHETAKNAGARGDHVIRDGQGYFGRSKSRSYGVHSSNVICNIIWSA